MQQNGTQDHLPLPPKELYCIMGCSEALNRYLQRLKALYRCSPPADQLGTPPAPALVADTLTATSLSLEWDGQRFSNMSYLVQWRYEEWAGAWQYCCNQSWGPHSTVLVENLQPYTKYRFRIALMLSPQHHSEPIVSDPSVVISTLPEGTPSSPPVIVRATAIDSARISVSWEPGPFPNGPVLSYMLQINELPEGYYALKDIPTANNTNFYMCKNLLPDRNYSVSVAMRNGVGEGPSVSILVSTPPEQTVEDKLKPMLIISTQHKVIRQIADIVAEQVTIARRQNTITGMAIHVSRRLLFISDSGGFVKSSSLNQFSEPRVILSPEQASFSPLSLSADWLNDQLYILGEVQHPSGPRWQVARCGLDGRGLTVAVAGFLYKPQNMQVDPYNGYLFWSINGGNKKGLYKLDLADISNGVKHEVLPDIISEDPHLGAFTVDHTNSGLLVVNNTKNTVVFVSLDRNEISNLRDNATVQPMFEGATSLVTANKIFYWTRDSTLYSEEEDPSKTHYFYHSTWPLEDDGPFVSIAVELPSAQPVPVPVNPPIGVQAIMGPELAKISWQVPHLLGHQGKGAWQNWSYQVEVIEESTGKGAWQNWSYQVEVIEESTGQSFSCGHTNTTSYTAYHLRPGTSYLIRCYACTTGGLCPPSSEFRGKTLRAGDLPDIVWSTAEGLLKSDVTGESVKTLVHHSNLKDQQGDYHYVDITWYRDKLYMVTNTTHVHWYNLTTHMSGQLRDVDSVGSIAVDWIGRKLYWSNDKQQLITRCNLNGSQQEPLPILEYVKELVIDSVHAFLYWSSGHGVECARLNGMQRRVYYPKEIFSGKQVMGLTLDMDRQAVYWIVRSYEGSKLYQAPTAEMIPTGQKVEPIMVSNLQYKNIEGPLCYFNDHLLWLQDDRNAVIGDLSGQNAALISGMSLSGLNVVAVTDPALHRHPRDYIGGEEINVIPETVQNSSIRVSGKWEKFRIEWEPVISVNYDQVFYEVKVDTLDQGYSGKPQQEVTTDWYVGYHHVENLPPYSRLLVTVKAFTYWGASAQVRSFVHSPASTPTVPVNPRVFVSYSRSPVQDKQEIMAVFRWDPPVSRNGVIEGYRVKSWLMAPEGEIHMNDSFLAGVENREYIARQLLHNATYFFEVQAFTVMGDGPTTNPVQADLDVETPVPKLLLSTPDAIKVTDCDRHENQTLSLSSGPPVDVAFMGQEGRVFWVSEMQELISSDMDGGGKVKMLVLNGTGLSITVDWVGRYIYWSEMDETGSGSAIFRLDLSQQGSVQPELVLRRNRLIHKVDISPFQSSLYWVETSRAGIGHLMTRKTNTGDVRPFFTVTTVRRKRESEACNCPDNPAVGQAMSIDQTDPGNPRVLWVDGWHGDIYMADTRGCHCTVLVNATVNTETGLPPTSVTTDHRLLYWSNSTEGRIYSVVKPTSAAQRQNKELEYMSSGVTRIDVSGVRRITALGLHLQPYPVRKCLWPRDPEAAPTLHARSAQSITLSLPQPRRERECGDVSMATIEYTVYYGPAGGWDCGSSLHECVSVPMAWASFFIKAIYSSPMASLLLTDSSQLMFTVTYSSTFEVTGLRPFHRYVFRVALRNYYSDLERISPVIGPAVILRTAPGAPSPPRNVTAVVLNPTIVEVSWLPPQEFNDETVSYQAMHGNRITWALGGGESCRAKPVLLGLQSRQPVAGQWVQQTTGENHIEAGATLQSRLDQHISRRQLIFERHVLMLVQVHWRSEEMVGGERRKGEKIVSGPSFPDAIQTASLSLLAGQTYFILVRANSSNSATSSDSGEVQVQMFPEPNDILLLYATAYSLNISWSPSPNVSVVSLNILGSPSPNISFVRYSSTLLSCLQPQHILVSVAQCQRCQGLRRPMSALSGIVQPCYLAYSLNILGSPSPNVSVVMYSSTLLSCLQPQHILVSVAQCQRCQVYIAVHRREIQWCEMGSGQWQNLPLQDATGEVNYFMRNLRPKTQYTFRLTMEYAPFQELYVWPLDGRFTYETLAPSPSFITFKHIDDCFVCDRVMQETAPAPLVYPRSNNWAETPTRCENYWNLSKLSPSLKYTFRARARNKHGWSDYGGSSRVFDLTAASMLADSGDLNPILYMVLPVGVSVCVLVVCALLYGEWERRVRGCRMDRQMIVACATDKLAGL
uniref:Fibronectin type-III domain-containing protein n=1 Tax=Timema shepardi TaxID=629360 RepID=A0A7R9AQL9_TIMSH|nr:unnamed protein product [Timema shepardi]